MRALVCVLSFTLPKTDRIAYVEDFTGLVCFGFWYLYNVDKVVKLANIASADPGNLTAT